MHTCELSSWGRVRAGGSEAQGSFWLHSKLQVCLGYLTAHLKNKKGFKQHRGPKERDPGALWVGTEGSGSLSNFSAFDLL